ncbi:MAG: RNA polymerase subunit sigma-24 [Kangiellaceae bacterium]|nr:RNA polymerase subunit sigma-24 [Kangiellaceae bacterium]
MDKLEEQKLKSVRQQLDRLYREQTGKMLAYLVSLLSDLSLAEEVWHETIEKALCQWIDETPEHPKAWLATVARNAALDRLRHKKLSLDKIRLIQALSTEENSEFDIDAYQFPDQQLKLIFTCCHPAVAFENQVALTLHSVCGLTTDQIAQALLLSRSTLEQRMTRAKRKIKLSNIPFVIPPEKDIEDRLEAVLQVIYLVFSAGFNDERDAMLPEVDLCQEATRLAKLVSELTANDSKKSCEAKGLLALMMFTLARRAARFDEQGNIVLLEQQNRSLWDWAMIEEADQILSETLAQKHVGIYQIQAAITGVHSLAKSSEQTDWLHIEALYSLLLQLDSSPVIRLNSAVATAFARGYEMGLQKISQLEEQGDLAQYASLYSAKADLLRRLECHREAIGYYEKAISLSHAKKEIDYYQQQIELLRR